MRTVTFLLGALLWYTAQAQSTSTDPLDSLSENVAITDRSLHDALVLYPNPVNQVISVRCSGCDIVRMPVEIRSMDGRLLRMDVLSPQQQLNVSDLSNGSYRLYLLDLGGVRAHRVFRVAR